MTVTTLVDIKFSKLNLQTNTSTGEQWIRLTLDEARELYAELSKLFPPKLIQEPTSPLQDIWRGPYTTPYRPYTPGPKINPYTPGPTVKYEVRDPLPHERMDAHAGNPQLNLVTESH